MNQKWYPTKQQLRDPDAVERSFRVLLDQHYALTDRLQALESKAPKADEKPNGPPPGSGPTDTQICGLRVQPVNPQTLANGATLKWNKVTGNFSFQ